MNFKTSAPYDRNRIYSARAEADTAELEELIKLHHPDLPKLEAAVTKAGFWQDGVGQWFRGPVEELHHIRSPFATPDMTWRERAQKV